MIFHSYIKLPEGKSSSFSMLGQLFFCNLFGFFQEKSTIESVDLDALNLFTPWLSLIYKTQLRKDPPCYLMGKSTILTGPYSITICHSVPEGISINIPVLSHYHLYKTILNHSKPIKTP